MNASVDLRSIVERVGGHVYDGGRRALVPGPGHSRRDRSLSLRLVSEGGSDRVLWFSHSGDTGLEVLRHLGIDARHDKPLSSFDRARLKRERDQRAREEERNNVAFCRSIWEGTIDLEGSPAETYLFSRGLILEGTVPVRWHPACARSKPRPDGDPRPPPPPPHGAMVALIVNPAGEPRGLHCTFITPDGRKAFRDRSRIMFGNIQTCAVPIGAPVNGVLGVGEGIESAGSYATLKGVPTWPLLSTSLMKTFSPPPGLRKLVIAPDNDDGGAGMEAAHELALRASRVCDVEIDPPPPGMDWNNVLLENAA